MIICLDPAHGGKDHGASGIFSKEKDINIKLAKLIGDSLKSKNITVVYTRKNDEYVDLQTRCNIANKSKCNYFISIDCNSSKNKNESGTEVYCKEYNGESERISKALQKFLVNLNKNKDRGIKKVDTYILKNIKSESCLIRVMFISNPEEEKKLNDEMWQKIFASGFANIISDISKNKGNITINEVKGGEMTSVPIMGEPLASAEQMENFLHLVNPNAPYYAKLYISIGKEEGVRGDIAFAQALIETNFFKFQSDSEEELNNFAGMRSIRSENKNESFETPVAGIRAHIQHLKAFASFDKINTKLEDSSFHEIQRGIAPNWDNLDSNWYFSRQGYGDKIVNLWRKILEFGREECSIVDKIYAEWKDKGIITQHIDLDKPMTWRDFLIIQSRLLDKG